MEIADCVIILDDYPAREIAKQLKLSITGTLGVIVKAKHLGIVRSVKPILAKIKATNFRLTSDLESWILREAQE